MRDSLRRVVRQTKGIERFEDSWLVLPNMYVFPLPQFYQKRGKFSQDFLRRHRRRKFSIAAVAAELQNYSALSVSVADRHINFGLVRRWRIGANGKITSDNYGSVLSP